LAVHDCLPSSRERWAPTSLVYSAAEGQTPQTTSCGTGCPSKGQTQPVSRHLFRQLEQNDRVVAQQSSSHDTLLPAHSSQQMQQVHRDERMRLASSSPLPRAPSAPGANAFKACFSSRLRLRLLVMRFTRVGDARHDEQTQRAGAAMYLEGTLRVRDDGTLELHVPTRTLLRRHCAAFAEEGAREQTQWRMSESSVPVRCPGLSGEDTLAIDGQAALVAAWRLRRRPRQLWLGVDVYPLVRAAR